MVKIYVHTKYGWDISIHCWDKTTSGLRKRTVAILKFYLLFQFWPMCSHRRVILHLSSKFRRNWTIGSRVMTSYRISRLWPYSRKSTPGFRFSDGICLRRWKSISMPNFDEIFQSMAEIKLLPVSEKGWPPYWNSISGFDLDVRVVIDMSFCICLPNIVEIRWSAAELGRYIEFSKWRP